MQFQYSRWRHGGWYVENVRYPSGACGCVSRNYSDRKWRIACDPRPFGMRPTFRSRDDAAQAELELIADLEAYHAENPSAHTGPDGWREDWEAFDAWRAARYKAEWLAIEAQRAAAP